MPFGDRKGIFLRNASLLVQVYKRRVREQQTLIAKAELAKERLLFEITRVLADDLELVLWRILLVLGRHANVLSRAGRRPRAYGC